ncbi:MAG: AAA family ATPase [Candidatus Woesearchaeota archaeon]
MKWYQELGFKNNPLESNPLKSNEEPYGYEEEVEKLLYHVEAGNAVLIEGPEGSGKTLLLGQVINGFGGKGKIIYLDGNKVNRRIDISNLLIGNQGFFRRFLKQRPKGMILLLDNAVALPRKSYELLQYYFDQDYIKSIVITTTDHKKLELPGSLKDRVGKRIFKTRSLSMDEAVELVLDRLNQDLISKDNLEKLFILSDKNMKKFLVNCETVLKYMVDNDLEEIDFKTISKVAGNDKGDEDEEDVFICTECGEELVKVGEHYRCKNCDMYCPVCGVLIEEEDYECPNCGVQFEDEEDE